MQTLPKVLLVEDDRRITAALAEALQNSHYVSTTLTGGLGLYKADTDKYDIIVLDLNLPDMPGLTVCQQLREKGLETPILVLSADSQTLTKINLLDAGANDYLAKPFSLGELKARMRALTRSTHRPLRKPTGTLTVSGLTLNRSTYEVSREDVPIRLRRKELALLECLMEHAGSVVTRRALTRYAWPGVEDLWTNTVDVHIKYLRDKIDRPFDQPLIKTVHGLGYKLETKLVGLEKQ
ncbi:MAG TPA: response regulator transcription factor [Candidatus Saccharimonadales bacterium]